MSPTSAYHTVQKLSGFSWLTKRFRALLLLLIPNTLPLQLAAARWFVARLNFDPEDGGYTFLRNVGSHRLHNIITTAVRISNPTISVYVLHDMTVVDQPRAAVYTLRTLVMGTAELYPVLKSQTFQLLKQ
jgi:hypothetical protein